MLCHICDKSIPLADIDEHSSVCHAKHVRLSLEDGEVTCVQLPARLMTPPLTPPLPVRRMTPPLMGRSGSAPARLNQETHRSAFQIPSIVTPHEAAVEEEREGSNVGSNVGSDVVSNVGSDVGSNAGSNVGSNVGSNRTWFCNKLLDELLITPLSPVSRSPLLDPTPQHMADITNTRQPNITRQPSPKHATIAHEAVTSR